MVVVVAVAVEEVVASRRHGSVQRSRVLRQIEEEKSERLGPPLSSQEKRVGVPRIPLTSEELLEQMRKQITRKKSVSREWEVAVDENLVG
jgi:hypothetical protein